MQTWLEEKRKCTQAARKRSVSRGRRSVCYVSSGGIEVPIMGREARDQERRGVGAGTGAGAGAVAVAVEVEVEVAVAVAVAVGSTSLVS